MYLNKVFLYGNLTRDPGVEGASLGSNVANFGLATNRTYKDKNGAKQETTEFHNVVAFGRTAEVIAQYVKKCRPHLRGRPPPNALVGRKRRWKRSSIVPRLSSTTSSLAPMVEREVQVPVLHVLDKKSSQHQKMTRQSSTQMKKSIRKTFHFNYSIWHTKLNEKK